MNNFSFLDTTFRLMAGFLKDLPQRRVAPTASVEELRSALGGPLPEGTTDPSHVLEFLAEAAEPGLMASASGRFFGFVIGGGAPAALGADLLTSAWDQNAALYAVGPAASVIEEVAGGWLKELFGLPADASFGFVTGGQMANFTGLAAARHHVLLEAGWDVERDGLVDAPPIRVIAGEERHGTVDRALRFLGLGTSCIRPVVVDDQGRMRVDALRDALAETDQPTIVCAQIGNINTGACDPIAKICEAGRAAGSWVHVDGAFGMWAAAAPSRRYLVEGLDAADSWATDAHKWLNVPYDCGITFCAHPASHRAAMTTSAAYLVQTVELWERDELDWNPEHSRRARGFPVYAAIRSLGRSGIADMIERSCAHARRFAELLGRDRTVEILNDVVLNQVLVRFLDPDGDHDRRTRAVIRKVQDEGTCWVGGSVWQEKAVMRISVTNWSTTTRDVDASVEAILKSAAAT